MEQEPQQNPTTMSIGDHIEDLRKRIIWSIIPPLPLAVLFFMFADPIVRWFLVPLYNVLEKHGLPTHVQVLSPPEFLMHYVPNYRRERPHSCGVTHSKS